MRAQLRQAIGRRVGRARFTAWPRNDDVAGQADFGFAEEEHGFVLPRFGFARRQQRAVVHIGRMGFAGEQGEARRRIALFVNMHAFGILFVEPNFHHARQFGDGIERGFFLRHVGGIFRPDDAQQVADGRGVGGAGFDALGQEPRIGFAGGDGGVQIRMGGFGGIVGFGGGIGFDVEIGVVRREHGHVRRHRAGGVGADAAFEGVVPFDVGGLLFGDEVLFCHNMLCFSCLTARKGGDFGGKSGLAE